MFLFLLAATLQHIADPQAVAVAPAESVAVTVVGEGVPVVMLPGLFGSAYGYRHVMAELRGNGFQSIGIEPLGMGSSSRPEHADYSLTSQADRVAAVMDSLAVREAVLVGHSLGASIAMRVAYRRPDLARGVVSLEGGPGETATTAGFRRWMRFAPVAGLLDGRGMIQRMLYREMKAVSFDDSWVEKGVVFAYTRGLDQDYRATVRAYRSMSRSEEPELLRDHLSAISCPVVLLVGDTPHDSGPSPAEVSLLRERLPAFTMDTVAQSGYFIQEEQPAAVVTVIRQFEHTERCAHAMKRRSAND